MADKNKLGAKTLFATHYHELTELEGKLQGVQNFCIAVKEKGDDIVFLRKIVRGGADKSYGIQVARLAGVPESVLSRARELVGQLVDADITAKVKDIASTNGVIKEVADERYMQMSLFDSSRAEAVVKDLKELDLEHMTPLEALNFLYEIREKISQ